MATPARETRDQHRINDRIRAREVRLIGPDGDQLGIKPVPEALRLARSLELDLVEVAPMANPPVCRIMDYGKFRYEEAQKAKESRRKSTNVTVKEVKFRPKIGRGDFDVKVRKVGQFIQEGHKVKVTLQFRGREMAHPELGARILDDVLATVGTYVKVETQARLEGRSMSMVLSPDKKAIDAAKHEAQEAGERPPEPQPQPADPAGVADTADTADTPDSTEPGDVHIAPSENSRPNDITRRIDTTPVEAASEIPAQPASGSAAS